METAIYIKTELWNQLIQYHIKEGWKVTYRYDNFDVGIDFDGVQGALGDVLNNYVLINLKI